MPSSIECSTNKNSMKYEFFFFLPFPNFHILLRDKRKYLVLLNLYDSSNEKFTITQLSNTRTTIDASINYMLTQANIV